MILLLVEPAEEKSSWWRLLEVEDALGHQQEERLMELVLAFVCQPGIVWKTLFSLFMSFHFISVLKSLLATSFWPPSWYLLLSAQSSWSLRWYLPSAFCLPTTAAATAELRTRTRQVERPLISGHWGWPLTTLSLIFSSKDEKTSWRLIGAGPL